LECNKEIEYIVKTVNKPRFCSNSCQGKMTAKTRKDTIVRRSKNESYFFDLCKMHFGEENVTSNEKYFDGWDADVIVHNKKLAILWNGVWHYKKVREKQSLEQIQNRDVIKLKIIEKYGYTAYTVKDMGKFNKKFVEQEFEIIRLCLIDI
jgi:hypothetical protein